MSSLGAFMVKIGADTNEFQRKMRDVQRSLKRTMGPEAMALSRNLARAMAGAAVAFGAVGVASVKMAADLETQRVAFGALLQSAEKAEKFLKSLADFAARTPFQFDDLVAASKKMLAFGFSADESLGVLRKVGDAAAGLGLAGDGIDRIVRALGQMRAKGSVATQEINQLAEVGIGAWEYLAEAAGKSVAQVQKDVEKRLVSAEDGISAILSGMDKRFAGLMEKQSNTVSGVFSTIRDNVVELMRSFGDMAMTELPIAESLRSLRDVLTEINGIIRESGFSEGMRVVFTEYLGETTRTAILGVAAALATALAPALWSVGAGLASALAPIAPYMLAISFAVTSIYSAWQNWDKIVLIVQYIYGELGLLGKLLGTLWDAGIAGGERFIAYLSEKVAEGFRDMIAWMTRALNDFGEEMSKSGNMMSRAIGEAMKSVSNGLQGALSTANDMLIQTRKSSETAEKGWDDAKDAIKRAWGAMLQMETSLKLTTWWLHAVNDGLSASIPWWDSAKAKASEYASEIGKVTSELSGLKTVMDFFGWATTGKPEGGSGGGKPTGGGGGGSKKTENVKELQKEIRELFAEFAKVGMIEPKGAAAFFSNLDQSIMQTKQKWADAISSLGDKWEEASARGKQAIMDALNQAGIAFRVTEQGKLDATAARIAVEKRMEEQKQAAILEYVRSGQMLEDELRRAANERDLTEYMTLLNSKNAAFLSHLQGEGSIMEEFRRMQLEANRSELSYLAEASQTLYNGLSQTLTDVIMGTKSAGDAFKQLGAQLVAMVVRWMIQRKLAAVLGRGLERAAAASSSATALGVTAAWSKAAAMVSLATFGANAGPAMAGIASTVAASSAMGMVPLAKGGIVKGATPALIGEGRHSEAVIPLTDSVLSKMGGNVAVNIYNNTGSPVQARQERSFDGQQAVVSVWLDAYQRNVGGLRDAVGSR